MENLYMCEMIIRDQLKKQKYKIKLKIININMILFKNYLMIYFQEWLLIIRLYNLKKLKFRIVIVKDF